MPAYLVSIVNVKDPDKYMEYAKVANRAAAAHGGKFLLRGVPLEVLEGVPPGDRVVISQWENADKARAYYRSREYAEAKKKRQGVADAAILLFEAVPE